MRMSECKSFYHCEHKGEEMLKCHAQLAARDAECARMKAALQEIGDEVNKAHAWHTTTGMKVAKTPRIPPSMVRWLKPIVDAVLSLPQVRRG